jgi:hypothetical protein
MTSAMVPIRNLSRRLRPRSSSLAAIIAIVGFASGGIGIGMAAAAATPVSAAGLVIPGCSGLPVTLAPGDSGSCNVTFSLGGSPGQVYLSATTSSASGGTGIGSEALLDGAGTGLQITLVDANSGTSYGIGSVSCTGGYPDATPCSSADSTQTVSSSAITSSNTDVVTVGWDFPIQASNPYQGGTATVTLQEEYSGTNVSPNPPASATPRPTPTPTGGALGASTTSSPTASPSAHHHGGVLGASTTTPTTGAELPVIFSRVLIVLGLVLIFAGLWVWRRQRYFTRG